MKLSYKWLRDYVKFSLSPQELGEKLTMAGIEVEEIINTLPHFEGIYVAEVKSVERHPNADKLSLCMVQTSSAILEVICGAPNVASGQKIAFAPVGTVLPAGLKIKRAKIRGIESNGMICSEQELGLTVKSDGIWELPEHWEIGSDVYNMIETEQDFILDLSITPNRPDAMSVTGIARELAAILDTTYDYPEIVLNESAEKADNIFSVTIDTPQGCPRYSARIIKNVKIGASPGWVANRLTAAGIRPINNIVDITNYVLLELGQPLHAFDLAKLKGKKIIVRDAEKGEKFTTLDEKEREIPAGTVMICDAGQAVAIGGIMGGLHSEVTTDTVDVLLESAYFAPTRIGASSKKLNLSSEASQRFERGTDPNGVLRASDRAAALIAQIAGGTVLKGAIDEYPASIKPRSIKVRTARINTLLGTSLNEKDSNEILARLGITSQGETANIPTFRPDLEREVDLIEEVARLINFDNIPVKDHTDIKYDTLPNATDHFNDVLKRELCQLGLNEVLTNGMLSSREISFLNFKNMVQILNPVSDDMDTMRPSLIPGLLKIVNYNINRNIPEIRIFELGRVFPESNILDEENQPYEIAVALHGTRNPGGWHDKVLDIDFYDIKGLVETLFAKIDLDNIEFVLYDTNVYFDPGNALSIKAGDRLLGSFGRLKKEVCSAFDIATPVYALEVSVKDLMQNSFNQAFYKPFSRYPYVEKDVAFIIDDSVQAGDVKYKVLKTGRPLLTGVEIFDVYQGDHLGKDKKSIAFRLRFQAGDRTLKDEEVSRLFEQIIATINKTFNATLRDQAQ